MSFALSLLGVVAVQKNVRDLEAYKQFYPQSPILPNSATMSSIEAPLEHSEDS